MDANTSSALQKALELIRAGQKEDANDILLPLIETDPNNPNTWYLLGFTLTDSEKRLYCYQQVLRIDPTNRAAQKQVELITSPQPASAAPKTEPLPVMKPAPTATAKSDVSVPISTPTPAPTPIRNPTPQAPKVKKSIQSYFLPIGIGVFVLIVLIAVGWFVSYYNDGKKISDQVLALFTEKNCTEVIKYDSFKKTFPPALFSSTFGVYHEVDECLSYLALDEALKSKKWSDAFNVIQSYSVKYPRGQFVGEMSEQAGVVLLSWSKDLMAEKDYKTAIAKAELAQRQYSNTSAGPIAQKSMFDDYLIWAKDSFEKGDYESAEKSLKIVGWDQKATPEQVKQADAALVVVYIAWGNAQVKNGDYEKGLESYARAKELDPTAQDYERLNNQIALRKMDDLIKSNKFDKALEQVDNLLQAAISEEIKADITAEKEKILNAYANSTSEQAETQMMAGITNVCNKQAPALPIFAIDNEKIRVRMGVAFNFDLGENFTAKTPAELHYVICIKQTMTTIQTCAYQGGHTLRRHRLSWLLTLYDVLTLKAYKTTQLSGSTPRGCAQAEAFYGDYSDIFGNQPEPQAVIDWLARLKILQ